MKDFRIVARIYNNQLRERREATGMRIYEFAESIGMSGSDYGAYESMSTSPLTSGRGPRGQTRPVHWKKGAVVIADALGVDPGVLWPEAVLEIKKTKSEIRVDGDDIAAMLPPAESSPFRMLSSGEETAAVLDALNALSPIEREVVERRFGLSDRFEETFSEIGEDACLSVERLRQIQNKALDKIKRQLASRGVEP